MQSHHQSNSLSGALEASRREALAGNYDQALILFDGVLAAIQRYDLRAVAMSWSLIVVGNLPHEIGL